MGKQKKRETNKNKYQKRQAKYFAKKSVQREKSVPKVIKENELQNWINDLEPLVNEANKRIELIQASGYTSYALDRVIRESGHDFFDLSEVKNREELLIENTRLRVFINDKGSTVEGAKLQTAQIYASKYVGKFGNQYNNAEHNYARFDTDVIDEEVAKKAFESYRKIEEHRASQIVGENGYGSNNFIAAIYDAEIRGLDSLMYGEDLLDTIIKIESDEWEITRNEVNSIAGITGIIEDNITGRYRF